MIKDFTKTMFQTGDRVRARYKDAIGVVREVSDANIDTITSDWVDVYSNRGRGFVRIGRRDYISMHLIDPYTQLQQELLMP